MKNPFSALFARKLPTAPYKSSSAPSTFQSGSEAANRQQLVLMTVRDLLRRSAIPMHWLECQTLVVNSRSRGTGLYIHLVVHHWDERLLRYTKAFQTELKERIVRFDPKAASWVHGIAWDLGALRSCPYPALPPKSTWDADQKTPVAKNTTTQTQEVAASEEQKTAGQASPNNPAMTSEVAQDLVALFAIRDRELDSAADPYKGPVTFDVTEPAPLR